MTDGRYGWKMDPKLHVGSLPGLVGDEIGQEVLLNEITLREEVVLPVALSFEEKCQVARVLAALGIKQVEVQTPDAQGLVRWLREEGVKLAVQTIVRPFFPDRYSDWRLELDAATESGADHILMVMRTSKPQLDDLRMTYETVVGQLPGYVNYARDRGGNDVVVCRADSTRAETSFVQELVGRSVEAGASRIHLADTLGVARPATIKFLMRAVQEVTDAPLGVHCHNDFGLALANALAAIEAGAVVVDVVVNGMDPERVGLTALEELSLALYGLYNYDCGVALEKLCETSRWFSQLTGIPVPPFKPVVGQFAFAQKRELTLQAAQRRPELFEPFDPELVGNRRWVNLGSGAGEGAVKAKLKELGLTVPSSQLAELVVLVNERAAAKGAPLDDDELAGLVSGLEEKEGAQL